MSDDERLERLTELAKRVWPRADGLEVGVEDGIDLSAEDGIAYVDTRDARIVFIEAPNALDALEAALLVLDGGPYALRAFRHGLHAFRHQLDAAADKTPAWAEALAAKWEAAARDAGGSGLVMSLAAELRARAKETP